MKAKRIGQKPLPKKKNYDVFRQVWAFVVRNANLSRRYLGWEIVFLVYHIVSSLSIGFLAKSMDPTGTKDNLL